MSEEEDQHTIQVLKDTQKALHTQDAAILQNLSNQTIHTASIYQHTDAISIAVIIYSLSKIITRKDQLKIKKWEKFVKKINATFDGAIRAINSHDDKALNQYLILSRKAIESISPGIKPYIQDVLLKASINKASRIYEHGISLSQTAELLHISPWELSEYVGQAHADEHIQTINEKKRAEIALEFFS